MSDTLVSQEKLDHFDQRITEVEKSRREDNMQLRDEMKRTNERIDSVEIAIRDMSDKIVDRIKPMVSSSKSYAIAFYSVQAIVFTIILAYISNIDSKIDKHANLEGHPETLSNVAGLKSDVIHIEKTLDKLDK